MLIPTYLHWGEREIKLPVKAAGPPESRVNGVYPVGGTDDHYFSPGVKAVHEGQQGGHNAGVDLVLARWADWCKTINFIEKNYWWSHLVCLKIWNNVKHHLKQKQEQTKKKIKWKSRLLINDYDFRNPNWRTLSVLSSHDICWNAEASWESCPTFYNDYFTFKLFHINPPDQREAWAVSHSLPPTC